MTVSAPAELRGTPETGSGPKEIRRLIVGTSIGNALEWYDIAIYGYFAVYVSKAFFPNNDPTTSLLLAFGTFGLSFLVRPIGGVVLGAYADRHGRKASLLISIVMMTIGTLMIAFMPGYETIGSAGDDPKDVGQPIGAGRAIPPPATGNRGGASLVIPGAARGPKDSRKLHSIPAQFMQASPKSS
jgi:MFS family permease